MSWDDTEWDLAKEHDLIPGGVRQQERQDRLIPLINVVFLLLAFFIISGTFRAADTLAIEPPQAETSGSLDFESQILFMTRDGALALGKKQLSAEQAVEELARWLAKDPDGEVQIKADAQVKARDILPLLRRLSDAKITSVRLIATRRSPPQ
jgi:biopolymer transport protein ExbD